jgi:hypothetical protein
MERMRGIARNCEKGIDGQKIADAMLAVFQAFPKYAAVFAGALDSYEHELSKDGDTKGQKRLADVDPMSRVNFIESSWIDDVDYEAVAVQYNERAATLDARIAPTPGKKDRQVVSRTEPKDLPTFGVDNEDYLDDVAINELMRILPYVVTETEIDAVLAQSR